MEYIPERLEEETKKKQASISLEEKETGSWNAAKDDDEDKPDAASSSEKATLGFAALICEMNERKRKGRHDAYKLRHDGPLIAIRAEIHCMYAASAAAAES